MDDIFAPLALLPHSLPRWFQENQRQLPWRQDREPYHVWLSEIMLQQTRVEAVKGYYARFLQALPTIQALSEVPEPQLLKLWEGLGYYTRARNLKKAAVVIMTESLKKDVRFIMKQRGGRMATGRLLGVQFDALFTDDLYFKISRHAIEMAHQIRDIFVSAGYPLLFDSPTNQQYPIMPDTELAEIGKRFGYEYWERVDADHSGVRFCASWATKQEHVDALREAVNALKK